MTQSFTLDFDENIVTLSLTPRSKGLWGKFRMRPLLDLDKLPKEEKVLAIVLARLRAMDRDGNRHGQTSDSLWIDHWLLSRIDDFSAKILCLPPTISGYAFRASMKGSIGSADFKLDWWWEKGGRTVPLGRKGAMVDDGQHRMRLPGPMFDAIELAENFDPSKPLAAHWFALGQFRRSLGDEVVSEIVSLDGFLRDLTIVTCDKVGLDVDEQDHTKFEALPFIANDLDADELPDRTSAALEGDELVEFQKQSKARGAQPAYKIGDGRFLILDRTAVPVVDVIAKYAHKSEEERRHFIENAAQIVSEAIEDQLRNDGCLNELTSPETHEETLEQECAKGWAETREWASRVIEISAWTKPQIETIDGSGTNWLPDDLDPSIGELLGQVPDADVEALLASVTDARARGILAVFYEIGTIPATLEVEEALARRLEMLRNRQDEDVPSDEVIAILPVTHDNFWEVDFLEQIRARVEPASVNLPSAVLTQLKRHQAVAFEWQAKAWRRGLPGVLNADEQGLGKTLQALSFLAWLTDGMKGGELPIAPFLIVAPTSLLRNWESEIEIHLQDGVWGDPIRLYGPNLSKYRIADERGWDIQHGRSKLDLSPLISSSRPQLAITTYQTLANYAVSFAKLKFAVTVFDEIQFLKNPTTLRSNAAKAVNADFKIGMTGTPVENATRDIWAIMDQLFPGALGALAEFRRIFDRPRQENIRVLNAAIFNEQRGFPALGIRRLKEQAAADLPPKVRILHPRMMPNVQAIRYDEARAKTQTMFSMLHHIRRTSLHPGLIEGEAPEEFTRSSARISAAMEILAFIKGRGERALVFAENRDVQAWFAELIKVEFGLKRVLVINGDTPVDQRKEITDRFQRHLDDDRGFDVLVMGPRAAGTGLTLTAANHVIHLTRWWNPAVEEQCNDRTHRIGQTKPVTVHIPLAVHPKLGPGSFDCLLQSLMKKKRSLANSVLLPSESDGNEVRALYDALINAGAETDEADNFAAFNISGRPDLDVVEIATDVIRVSSKSGGSSVLVASEKNTRQLAHSLELNDAAVIVMKPIGVTQEGWKTPLALLPNHVLWPEFILPE